METRGRGGHRARPSRIDGLVSLPVERLLAAAQIGGEGHAPVRLDELPRRAGELDPDDPPPVPGPRLDDEAQVARHDDPSAGPELRARADEGREAPGPGERSRVQGPKQEDLAGGPRGLASEQPDREDPALVHDEEVALGDEGRELAEAEVPHPGRPPRNLPGPRPSPDGEEAALVSPAGRVAGDLGRIEFVVVRLGPGEIRHGLKREGWAPSPASGTS